MGIHPKAKAADSRLVIVVLVCMLFLTTENAFCNHKHVLDKAANHSDSDEEDSKKADLTEVCVVESQHRHLVHCI